MLRLLKRLTKMRKEISNVLLSYTAPSCRVGEVGYEQSFLLSGDFGDGGYPGKDLEPGDEWDL